MIICHQAVADGPPAPASSISDQQMSCAQREEHGLKKAEMQIRYQKLDFVFVKQRVGGLMR